MGKYLLHGKLNAKEGEGEKLLSILLQASRSVADIKGCTAYIISRDNNDNDAVWVTEIWDSKADHDNSLQNASVKAVIAMAVPVLAQQQDKGQELEIIGGLGA